jgi:hypothetical protein
MATMVSSVRLRPIRSPCQATRSRPSPSSSTRTGCAHGSKDGLAELSPGVTVHSRARHRTPTLLLTFAGLDAADAYRSLAAIGVNAPAGSFSAIEARHLRLGDTGGAVVDRLLEGLRAFTCGVTRDDRRVVGTPSDSSDRRL